MRYVAHNPSAWNDEFETYTQDPLLVDAQAEWPRLAMVQALIGQVQYLGPGRLRLGAHQGADAGVRRRRRFSAGTPADFQERHEADRRDDSERTAGCI